MRAILSVKSALHATIAFAATARRTALKGNWATVFDTDKVKLEFHGISMQQRGWACKSIGYNGLFRGLHLHLRQASFNVPRGTVHSLLSLDTAYH
jgi:hypothetical protein